MRSVSSMNSKKKSNLGSTLALLQLGVGLLFTTNREV